MKPQSSSCADKLKIIADSTRLAILESLIPYPKRVSELGNALDIEQSLLSHHLAHLRAGGLVQSTRQGKAVLYQLTPHVTTASEGKVLNLGCCQLSFPSPTKKR